MISIFHIRKERLREIERLQNLPIMSLVNNSWIQSQEHLPPEPLFAQVVESWKAWCSGIDHAF